MSVTVGLGAHTVRARGVRRSFRSKSFPVSSIAFALVWLVAVVAFVLMTMQLPQGTEPRQAAEPGAAQTG